MTSRTTLLAAATAAALGAGAVGTYAVAGPTPAEPTLVAKKKAAVAKRGKTGPKGKAGARGVTGARGTQGAPGPQGGAGPQGAPATDIAKSISLNWRVDAGSNGSTATDVPGIGTVTVVCTQTEQVLRISPSTAKTVVSLQEFQSASSNATRVELPRDIPLPVNGMLTGVISVEPTSGDGGPGPAPASFVLSSERKLNAESETEEVPNFCSVNLQVLRG